jgi:hypothetical protein
MRLKRLPIFVSAALVVAFASLDSYASAETTPATPRTVEQILGDFVRASGGDAPWKKHRSLSVSMTISVRGLGLNGTATALWTAKGQYLETGDLPNMLSMKRGSDGRRYWSQDPIDGLRWLQGSEAEQAEISGAWMGYLRLSERSKRARLVSSPSPDLECVEVTYKQSPPTTYCFDTKTHLMTLEQGKKSSPQGDTPYITRASDYRDTGGAMMPFVQETTAGPATFVVTVQKAMWDVPSSASQFALPKAGKK